MATTSVCTEDALAFEEASTDVVSTDVEDTSSIDTKEVAREDECDSGAAVSRFRTGVIITNAVLGTSPLALPYAMQQSGWALLAFLILFSVALSFTLWLTGHVLGLVDARAAELGIPRLRRDWSTVGQLTFGRWGFIVVAGFVLVDLYTCVLSTLVLAGDNLHLVFAVLPTERCIVVLGLLLFFLALVPERFLDRFAIVGILSFWLIIVSIVLTGGELLFFGEAADDQIQVHWQGLSAGMGVVLWLFFVHSEAPLIYQMMEDRSQWHVSVALGMSGASLIVLVVAVCGYAFFGGACQESITDNLGRNLDLQLLPGASNAIISGSAALFLTVKLMTSVPLQMAPIIGFMEEQLGIQEGFLQVCLKAMFVAITTAICLHLGKHFATILEVSAPLVQAPVCTIFPCAAFLKLKTDLGLCKRSLLWVTILVAAVYAVVGTAASIYEAIE